jgi:carbamoyl-phosphate synthase large subunit
MNKFRVLVFPGGTEVGLEINRALRACKEVELFSAGLDVSNHAPYVFARHFTVPSIYESGWVETLNRVILEQGIDYIFPAYDDVIVALAENAERIKARIVSSPPQTCLITRSKSQTYRLLSDTLPVPKLWDDISAIDKYPVFVKPDRGQGSQRANVARDRSQLYRLLEEHGDLIVTEYLCGDEFTVDCFSDREAGILFCSGRRRIRTRNGISMNSRVADDPVFRDYAERITSKLTLHGAWFFQVRKDGEGAYKLMEVAPRIAGTMALNSVRGVNLPLLSIYEQARTPVKIMTNDVAVEIDRALVNRYRHNLKFGAVYVDLDDTLVLNDVVNTSLVRFLYQCVNAKIRIVLLTRHTSDVGETLRKHRLSGLFDEVICLDRTGHKADYIREAGAILIDDSFSERRAARQRLRIPTFDCSMVEMLTDERA